MDSEKGERTASLLSSTPCPPNIHSLLSETGKKLNFPEMELPFFKDEAAVKQGKNLIRLAFGSPALETNPLVGVHLDLKDGTVLHLDDAQMAVASSYGSTKGYGPLNEWLLQLQKDEHRPRLLPIPDHPIQFDLIITSGAFDGLRNALHCLMNEDDSVILETEVFGNVTTAVQLYGTEVGVAHDDQGIIPGHLEQLLSTWPQTHPGRPLPKAVYVITAGNNPTGYNWSEQRMVDIYSVCRKYNILILEDGAYYFLQFGQKRNPSFQSIDMDGRVVRFDSFSKVFGPGYRLGWTTGPKELLQKMAINKLLSSVHTNQFAQVVIYNVLNHWGYETFQEKVTAVAELYRKKAMFVEQVAQKHLKGLCSWTTPEGGMFFWFTVLDLDVDNDFIDVLRNKGVSILAGYYFLVGSKKSSSLRLSFSQASQEVIEKGIKILADVIREQKGVTE